MRRISNLDRPQLMSIGTDGVQGMGLAGRPQVVSALRGMHVAQRASHRAFDDDLILDPLVAVYSPTITGS